MLKGQQDEIIVKSSRLIKDSIVGSQSYIINKEYIQSNPSKSIPELIAKLPGIKIKDLRGGGLGATRLPSRASRSYSG